MASCTQLQHGEVQLGKPLAGIRVQICDGLGRVLPPQIPGFLVLQSDSLPEGKQATGLRISYTWDGALTLLTPQVKAIVSHHLPYPMCIVCRTVPLLLSRAFEVFAPF